VLRVLAAFLVALSGLAAAGADDDLRVRIKTGILIGAYPAQLDTRDSDSRFLPARMLGLACVNA